MRRLLKKRLVVIIFLLLAQLSWSQDSIVQKEIKSGIVTDYDGNTFAGRRLKSKGNIDDSDGVWPKDKKHYGTNFTGFSGIPGGKITQNGSCCHIGGYGYWWSSVRLNSGEGFVWILSCDKDNFEKNTLLTNYGASVRCVSY